MPSLNTPGRPAWRLVLLVGTVALSGCNLVVLGPSGEVAAQQGKHAANPLQAETTATQVAEDGQLGKIFCGVNATMTFAGGHHDSLLIPPLKLPWREAGTC